MWEWEERVKSTARQIEAYLESHPHAADSAEGIASWWIAKNCIRYELNVVFAALKQLAQAGIVTIEDRSDGNDAFYRLNNKQ